MFNKKSDRRRNEYFQVSIVVHGHVFYFILFKFYSGACITNWFVSGEIDDTGDLSSRDGVAKDRNLFRGSNLEAEEYDSSQATTKPSAYTGMCTCLFLAHLSRRLKGELIVYRSIRRPCVSASVRLCVRKHFQTRISPQPVGQS